MEMALKVDKRMKDLDAFYSTNVVLYDLCSINSSQKIKSQTHFQYQKVALKSCKNMKTKKKIFFRGATKTFLYLIATEHV